MSIEVVLATHNQHKVEEFQKILGGALPGLNIVAYDGPDPVEDGTSFAENALIKARVAAAHTGKIALADDSGIAVDLLGGAPGIFSARWAGPGKNDRANLELLLAQLSDIAPEHRGAQFVCNIAIVNPGVDGSEPSEDVVAGIWTGALAREPQGENGFGYDPVFLPAEFEVSAAELTPEQKNQASHRARAFERAIPVLNGLIGA
ncbi:RdgB/HAM1 family non-canonical purine NTP pyrophosphatase [Mycetocola saprophilus]|uniref:RdgB/HAM1 family non-canonical purine NTP pyrophosphatase n=1 Tax=Mycetocola saprophilus TaxID=76636 RepID=UPI003BF1A600